MRTGADETRRTLLFPLAPSTPLRPPPPSPTHPQDDKNMPWAGGDTDDEDEPLPEEEEAEGAAKKPKKGGKKAKAKGAAVNVEAAEEDPVMAILMGACVCGEC